jgi:hypothetical protein
VSESFCSSQARSWRWQHRISLCDGALVDRLATTVREAIVYRFIVLGPIGSLAPLGGDEYMRLLGVICFSAAIGSLPLLLISPGTAHMADGGGKLGLFRHQNFLGQVMATGALALLYAMPFWTPSARPQHSHAVRLHNRRVCLASGDAMAHPSSSPASRGSLRSLANAARLVAVLLAAILTPFLLVVAADTVIGLLGQPLSC